MSTTLILADRCRDAGFSADWCARYPWDDPTVPGEGVPYDAPGTGGAGEAWSFLGMGANMWFVIVIGVVIWALVASARRRHREEMERHDALRERYADQAAPESNLGGGGEWADWDEHSDPMPPPRSMYGDAGHPHRDDDWEEL